MPRKDTVSDHDILTELQTLDVFDGDVLKIRSHTVWKILSRRLENKIKPASLYMRVQQDRHRIKESIKGCSVTASIKIKNEDTCNHFKDNNAEQCSSPIESIVRGFQGCISNDSENERRNENFNLLCFEKLPDSPQKSVPQFENVAGNFENVSTTTDTMPQDDVGHTITTNADAKCIPEEKIQILTLPSEFLKKYWVKGALRFTKGWTHHFAKAFAEVNPYCVLKFEWHALSYGCRKARFHRFNAQAVCKLHGCMSFKFYIDSDLDDACDAVVKYIEYGKYNHDEGDVHRRQIRGEQRKQKGFEMGSTAPSIQALRELKSVPEDVLAAGNRNDAPSAMLLAKIAQEHRARNDVDAEHHNFMCKLKQELDSKPELKGKHFSGYIQGYGFYPFYTILFTPLQLTYLIDLAKSTDVFCYLDSTGTVIRLPPQGGKRPYYYALVVSGSKECSPIPIAEFISCVHTTTYIELFLSSFFCALKRTCQRKKPVISKLEMDFSRALIQASITVFHGKTLTEYLNDRWQEVVQPSSDIQPITVIHICSSHIFRALIQRIEKSTKDPVVRKLLANAVALLIHSSTLNEAVQIFRDIAITFGAPNKSKSFEESFSRIAKAETAETGTSENDKQSNLDIDDFNEHLLHCKDTIRGKSPFYHHFESEDQMVLNFLEMNSPEEPNNLYAPKFLRILLNEYFPYFPLWSGIVLQRLGLRRDSNTTVENWFKITKHFIFEGKIKQSVPRFIQQMESLIIPRLRLQKYGLRTTKQKENDAKKQLQARSATSERSKKKIKIREDTQKPSINLQEDIDFSEEYWNRKQKRMPIKGCFKKFSKKIKSNRIEHVEEQEESNLNQDDDLFKIDDQDVSRPCLENFANTHLERTVEDSIHSTITACDNVSSNTVALEKSYYADAVIATDVTDLLPTRDSNLSPWQIASEYPANWTSVEYLVVYDIQLYNGRLKSLMPNAWVNDSVINAFLSILSNVYEGGPLHFDVYFVEALMCRKERNFGYYARSKSEQAWTYDCWLIPINSGDTHWTLLLVVFPHKCFIYLDSMHGTPRAGLAENICNYIDNIFNAASLAAFDWTEWTLFCPRGIPHQRSGNHLSGNCRVHLSTWAYIIYSSSYIFFDENEMNNIRKWMLNLLLKLNGRKPIKSSMTTADKKQKTKLWKENLQNVVDRNIDLPETRVLREAPMGSDSTAEYCASLRSLLEANKSERYSFRERRREP